MRVMAHTHNRAQSGWDQRWAAAVAGIREYAAQHGNTYPPLGYRLPDGRRLDTWCSNTRREYDLGRLPAARARDLETVPHWVWRTASRAPRGARQTSAVTCWHVGYPRLVVWTRVHGRAPGSSVVDDDGYRLGWFVTSCRRLRGRLNARQRQLLEALPGWQWTPTPRQDTTSLLQEAVNFVVEHGFWPSRAAWVDAAERRIAVRLTQRAARQAVSDMVAAAGVVEPVPSSWAQAWRRAMREPGSTRAMGFLHYCRSRRLRLSPAQERMVAQLQDARSARVVAGWLARAERLVQAGSLTANDWRWVRNQSRRRCLMERQRQLLDQLYGMHRTASQRAAGAGLAVLHAANRARLSEAAQRAAGPAVEALEREGLPGQYRPVLAARVEHPDWPLVRLAGSLGLTKDAYASRLRRALVWARQDVAAR